MAKGAYDDLMESLQKYEKSDGAKRDAAESEKRRKSDEEKKRKDDEERQRIERERQQREGGAPGRFGRGIEAWQEMRDAAEKERKLQEDIARKKRGAK